MKIDVDKIISPEELLDDFEGICGRLESEDEAFIFQKNKPSHVLMTINYYQKLVGNVVKRNTDIIDHADNDDLDTMLNKIGKRIFVEYYNVFKADDKPEDKLTDEGFSLNSRRSRSSSARRIFRDDIQIAALKNIIQSPKLDVETLEKAKDLLKAETGSIPDVGFDDREDLKIGKTVRFLLSRLLQGGHLDKKEVKSMTEEEYSKDTFNLNFQVLKEVDDDTPIKEQKRDHNGYNRFYDSPIVTDHKKYLLCSQWVDNLHRKAFEQWLEDKLMAILISRVEALNSGIEFGIRDQLNDFWQYVPYNTRRSLGKKFYNHAISEENIEPIEKRNNNQFYKML